MGKVGSQTVYVSLKALDLPNPIYHLHFLSRTRLAVVQQDIERLRRKKTGSSFVNRLRGQVVHHHYLTSMAVRRRLAAKNDEQIILISLIRDPIARRVSGFFETMWMFHPELIDNEGNINCPEARSGLIALLSTEAEQVDKADWFKKELQSVFDIDAYAYPFIQDAGYGVIEQGGIKLLLLTLEQLAENTGVLRRFLDYKGEVRLISSNRASSKRSGDAYAQILETLKLPTDVSDKFYNLQLARHFYDVSTRERFKERWSS